MSAHDSLNNMEEISMVDLGEMKTNGEKSPSQRERFSGKFSNKSTNANEHALTASLNGKRSSPQQIGSKYEVIHQSEKDDKDHDKESSPHFLQKHNSQLDWESLKSNMTAVALIQKSESIAEEKVNQEKSVIVEGGQPSIKTYVGSDKSYLAHTTTHENQHDQHNHNNGDHNMAPRLEAIESEKEKEIHEQASKIRKDIYKSKLAKAVSSRDKWKVMLDAAKAESFEEKHQQKEKEKREKDRQTNSAKLAAQSDFGDLLNLGSSALEKANERAQNRAKYKKNLLKNMEKEAREHVGESIQEIRQHAIAATKLQLAAAAHEEGHGKGGHNRKRSSLIIESEDEESHRKPISPRQQQRHSGRVVPTASDDNVGTENDQPMTVPPKAKYWSSIKSSMKDSPSSLKSRRTSERQPLVGNSKLDVQDAEEDSKERRGSGGHVIPLMNPRDIEDESEEREGGDYSMGDIENGEEGNDVQGGDGDGDGNLDPELEKALNKAAESAAEELEEEDEELEEENMSYKEIFFLIILVFSLFFPDAFDYSNLPEKADIIRNVIMIVCFAIFTYEIFDLSHEEPGYFLSSFFFLDIMGTLALALDLTWVLALISSGGSSVAILRATRSSKLGIKSKEIFKLFASSLRIMRVLRVSSIWARRFEEYILSKFGHCCKPQEEAERPDYNEQQMRILDDMEGKKSEVMESFALRLSAVVMALIIAVPFLQYNANDYSANAWLDSLRYLGKADKVNAEELVNFAERIHKFYEVVPTNLLAFSFESPYLNQTYVQTYEEISTVREDNQEIVDGHYSIANSILLANPNVKYSSIQDASCLSCHSEYYVSLTLDNTLITEATALYSMMSTLLVILVLFFGTSSITKACDTMVMEPLKNILLKLVSVTATLKANSTPKHLFERRQSKAANKMGNSYHSRSDLSQSNHSSGYYAQSPSVLGNKLMGAATKIAIIGMMSRNTVGSTSNGDMDRSSPVQTQQTADEQQMTVVEASEHCHEDSIPQVGLEMV